MTASENFASIESLLNKLALESTTPNGKKALDELQSLIQKEKQRSTGILQKFRLDDQVALVTGGSRGIGFAIAKALGEAGCKVAIASVNLNNAKKAAEKLREKGIETMAIQVQVSEKESVDGMVKEVMYTWGQLHIAVNNAGVIGGSGDTVDVTSEQWDNVIDINLKGVFQCAQAEIREMLSSGYGKIINIASVSGHISSDSELEAIYEISKAGVIRLTKALGAEYADKGITVNCISPGYIETEMIIGPTFVPFYPKWLAKIPMKRFAQVEELCGAVLLMASPLSSYMTGSDVIIDGGLVLW